MAKRKTRLGERAIRARARNKKMKEHAADLGVRFRAVMRKWMRLRRKGVPHDDAVEVIVAGEHDEEIQTIDDQLEDL